VTLRRGRVGTGLLAGALALLLCGRPLHAHEIPQRVVLSAFIQRDGTVLRLYLRVPLEAMRDVDFPIRADGSLDLVRVRALLPEAAQTWIVNGIRLSANGATLGAPRVTGIRVVLPNDRSFATLASARAGFLQPPIERDIVQWRQLLMDVALEYPLPAGATAIALHPELAHLGIRTTSVVHIIGADKRDRVVTYDGNPESVELDPAWYRTAFQFITQGVSHILGGIDHLLFVFCLVLPLRRMRALVQIITAFTLAHSLTLAAAALEFTPTALWFPPLVEALIAASIVWLCLENIVLPPERLAARWPMAFGFGLIHGFGFSFALRDALQFAGDNLVTAIAAFNVGVELGQVFALAVFVPAVWCLHRYVGQSRARLVTIVGSALVAHTAWHWLGDRGAVLARYHLPLRAPAFDAALALGAMRAALLAAMALALALALRQILRVMQRSRSHS